MARIAADFSRETGHKLIVVSGATGNLYAQIRNGAPFELLLAADAQTPKKLEDLGLTVPGQRFTYAVGRLVLYSAGAAYVGAHGEALKKGEFAHLALANPKTAPYGAAAIEALKSLGLLEVVGPKFVQGESIAQTFEFAYSGNAELGFVALSQVAPPDKVVPGSWWIVPQELYAPIRQDAVLLKTAEGHPAALALMYYLRSEKAKTVIRSYGYDS